MKFTFRPSNLRIALTTLGVSAFAIGLGACMEDLNDGSPIVCPTGPACTEGTGGNPSNSSSDVGTGGEGGFGIPTEAAGAVALPPTIQPPDAPDGKDAGPPEPDGGGNEDAGFAAACEGLEKTPKILYMSADDSNSMGSPGHVREIINIGFEPTASRIRTYEFLNYYRIAYPPPVSEDVAIFPEMERTTDPLIADFQIAIRSFNAPMMRRPMNFTFLVDTSGSMKGPGIQRARAAIKALASQFVLNDVVSLITTDESAAAALQGYKVTAPNDPELIKVADALVAGGNTNLKKGLDNAYGLAKTYRADNRMNRVIVISDGGTNVGVTDVDFLSSYSYDGDKEGIYFVGIGTGPALSYNDPFMDRISDAGRGGYVYLDSEEEATNVLAKRFDEVMDIAARAVQVELTLPWYFNAKGISTEGNLSTTQVEAQHLAPSDAMVFYLQTTACDPSFYDRPDPVGIRVFWKTRDNYTPKSISTSIPLNTLIGKNSPTMAKARAIVAYAEALKGCGLDKHGDSKCKDETERRKVTKEKLLEARTLANTAKNGMEDTELDEIISIINVHPLIMP